MSAAKPVLRIAPSPTGFLHIGTARTALFNYLYAKHTGGTFLLRVEDTDKERSTPEATEAILKDLAWLGLQWDGEVYFQSAHEGRHKEVAYELLEKGAAYKCYASAEELKEFRAANLYAKYQSPWRAYDGKDLDMPFSIRIRAPQTGDIVTVEDKVQGTVRVPFSEMDDFIVLRSDGTPTYLLAVVVDDHDMGITHVVRGDDHLTNTFRQNMIYRALGWDVPVYAHCPMIHGTDGAKLSKRHGALAVGTYREMGFLPEAICNYLLRLGWSHGDDEIIPMNRAIELFELSAINRAPGRLDIKKMEAVNQHYIKEADNDRLADLILEKAPIEIDRDMARTRLIQGMKDLKQRVKTIVQLTDESDFYWKNFSASNGDEKVTAISKEIGLSADINTLNEIENILKSIQDWTESALEAALKALAADRHQGKLAEVMKPLRTALTRRTSSPSLPGIMVTLGRDETMARVAAAAQDNRH